MNGVTKKRRGRFITPAPPVLKNQFVGLLTIQRLDASPGRLLGRHVIEKHVPAEVGHPELAGYGGRYRIAAGATTQPARASRGSGQ